MSSLRTRRVEVALVAAFALIVGTVILRHEMWRDELQAWLIAQASDTPRELLHNTRYEGHPILWYALLWPFAHLSHSPRLEQTIEWLLAVGAVTIVVLRAPFSRMQKALYVLGYFVVFEYGVMARSYTLGMLLVFGAVAVAATPRSDGTRRWSAVGVLLAACAFTSAFGTLLAGAVLAGLLVDEWVRGRSRRPIVLGALGGVVVAIAAYAQARPAPGTSSLAEWHTDVNVHRAAGALAAVSRALLPVPKVQHAFWNTSVTDGSTTIAALLSVVAILAVAWALRRTAGALMTWVVGNVAVVGFSYLKLDEFSTMRYVGHLFVLLVAVLWLRTSMHARPDVDDARELRFVAIGFTALLAVQAAVGLYAVARDVDGRFSDAKAAAAYLDNHYAADTRIIVDPDFAGSALSAYLDRPLRYVQGNRTGTFVLWDAKRLHDDGVAVEPVPPLVFVTNSARSAIGANPTFRLVVSFTDGIVDDEHYWIYALRG
jgi:hypothetical protein